jgi:hypothetical protein
LPTFRLHSTDGHEQLIDAGRVIATDTQIRFERPNEGQWTAVDEVPLERVARVERRCTEYDGRWHFVEEKAVATALTAPDGDLAGLVR